MDCIDGRLRPSISADTFAQIYRLLAAERVFRQGRLQPGRGKLVDFAHPPRSGCLHLARIIASLEDRPWKDQKRHLIEEGLDNSVLPAMADRPVTGW